MLTFVAETVSELREFQSVVTLALKKFWRLPVDVWTYNFLLLHLVVVVGASMRRDLFGHRGHLQFMMRLCWLLTILSKRKELVK